MSRPRPLTKEEGEYLRSRLYVEDGELYAKYKYSSRIKLDVPLGCKHNAGYKQIRLGDRLYLNHRIIYFLHTGEWPLGVVDHIDGDPSNNKVENLRSVTQKKNTHNYAGGHVDSTSRYRGVSYYTRVGKYVSSITKDGVKYNLGYYICEKEAALAYNYKAVELGFSPLSYNQVFKD